MNLKHLTDNQLHTDTKNLAAYERKITLQLLHHLKEVERRKLFCEYGYQSLFSYCVGELGFSEGAATRRIVSSRAIADMPELEKKLKVVNLP